MRIVNFEAESNLLSVTCTKDDSEVLQSRALSEHSILAREGRRTPLSLPISTRRETLIPNLFETEGFSIIRLPVSVGVENMSQFTVCVSKEIRIVPAQLPKRLHAMLRSAQIRSRHS